MDTLTTVGSIIGAIIFLITGFFAVRSFSHWLRPIRINPSINLVLDGSSPEYVRATVTNISEKDQVLVRCVARNAYPNRTAIIMKQFKRQIKNPLQFFKNYRHFLYTPIVFELMNEKPARLVPMDRKVFSHTVSRHRHPMKNFFAPLIQIEVQLSNGRIFYSGLLEIPERWMHKQSGGPQVALLLGHGGPFGLFGGHFVTVSISTITANTFCTPA